MRRRRLLAGLAVALAGCASTPSGDGNWSGGANDTDTPTSSAPTTTETPPQTTEAPRWEPGPATSGKEFSSLSVSDATVESDAFFFSVETVGQATAERPARFRATLTNVSEEAVEVGFTGSPGLSAYWTDGVYFPPTDVDGAVIYHAGGEGDAKAFPAEPTDGCWQVDTVAREDLLVLRTLDAGASVSETYAVFGSEGCPPAGDHPASGSWQIEGEEVGWSFTLTVG